MAAVVLVAAFIKGAVGFGFPALGTPLLILHDLSSTVSSAGGSGNSLGIRLPGIRCRLIREGDKKTPAPTFVEAG